MTQVCGKGYGDKHDWREEGSLQWSAANLPSDSANTRYRCVRCMVEFRHYYHVEPNIFEAMKEAGVPENCQRAEWGNPNAV